MAKECEEGKDAEDLQEYISKAKDKFSFFIKHIFPLSFKNDTIVKAPHTFMWADRIQFNKKTATLSARKHLKSVTIYAFILWKIFRMKPGDNFSWLYMSYNQKMSAYHTMNIKQLIKSNPVFSDIQDSTHGNSILDYTWGDGSRFRCTPSGILTFNRGWHGDGVICDDILTDPSTELNFGVIDKINTTFREQVMSLPKEGGEIHLVGTSQHQSDLFFQLKDNASWDWAEYKAILDEANKITLWPELFSYERLCEIRNDELGEKAFSKEYMCAPVWSEKAYFKREEIMRVVNPNLEEKKQPASEYKDRHCQIIAGLDIGKKLHPSHLVIFELRGGHYTQIYEKFMDNWDYSKQVDLINDLIEFHGIDKISYDDTRSELEGFRERKIIDPKIWKPIVFTSKSKYAMASNFSRLVNNKKDGEPAPLITLLNNQRMVDSILALSDELKAAGSAMGHGDAFWSIGLALYKDNVYHPYISV